VGVAFFRKSPSFLQPPMAFSTDFLLAQGVSYCQHPLHIGPARLFLEEQLVFLRDKQSLMRNRNVLLAKSP
jgi:hypothetical protein